jgi:membrane protease subunit HflK
MTKHAHTPARSLRPLGPRPVLVLLLGLAAAWAATGFYALRTNEKAVVRRCGRALDALRTHGPHFGFPYGIDRVTRVKVLEFKRVAIGGGLADRALGRTAEPQKAECLTGDRNLILVSAIVQYRIRDNTRDAKAALFAVADLPALVRNVAASALTDVLAGMNVDDVLTVERDTIRREVRRITQEVLDRYGAGVEIKAVLFPTGGIAPPQEVTAAFSDVNSARVDARRAIDEATGYQQRLLPEARGEDRRIRTEAEGFAEEVVQKARGDADRFRQVAAQLAKGRDVTTRRLILETMEEVLPRLKKIIVDGGTGQPIDLGLIEEND